MFYRVIILSFKKILFSWWLHSNKIIFLEGDFFSSKKKFFSGWLFFNKDIFSGWLSYKKIFFSGRFLKKNLFRVYFFYKKDILLRVIIQTSHCWVCLLLQRWLLRRLKFNNYLWLSFCNDEFSISVNTVSNILLFELSPLLLSRLKAWALGSPISPFSMLRTSKVTVMMMVLGVVAMMMVITMIMIMTTKKLRMIIVICFLISMLCASKVIAMATGCLKKSCKENAAGTRNPTQNWMLLGQMFPWTLLGSA